MPQPTTWLDRYSRQVVGWDVRESLPEGPVSEALRRAWPCTSPRPGCLSIPTKYRCGVTWDS